MDFDWSLWGRSSLLWLVLLAGLLNLGVCFVRGESVWVDLAVAGWYANALLHACVVVYMAVLGVGDLSFTGPFSDPGLQVQNLIAVPLTVFFFWWARWAARGARRGDGSDWGRHVTPIIFGLIGWLTVWPKFFREDQFAWPLLYTGLWVGIFWSETAAIVGSLIYIFSSHGIAPGKGR